MNKYTLMKQGHQKEFADFPMVYAFGKQQIEEGMRKLGLNLSDMDKICTYFGIGDILRKSDVPALEELLKRHEKERLDAIATDKTGDGFIYEMVYAELENHEYCITGSYVDTLNAIGMTLEEVNADPRFVRAFSRATREQLNHYDELMKNS